MTNVKTDDEYSAKDALNETMREQKMCLPPKKIGTFRSNYRIPKNNDTCVCIKMGCKTTWENFKKCQSDTQKKYILDMLERYPGIGAPELSTMFNIGTSTIFNVISKYGIKLRKGRKTQSDKENVEKFMTEVCKIDSCNSSNSDIEISSMSFICNSSDVVNIMKKYGFSGRVKITIETIEKND